MKRYLTWLAFLLFPLATGCTSITISGNTGPVSVSTTTMINGNSATLPVGGLPGIP